MTSALHIDAPPRPVAPMSDRREDLHSAGQNAALASAADEAVRSMLSGDSPAFLAKARQSPGE